ncbi:hypothetical protein [Nocardioides dilutus]
MSIPSRFRHLVDDAAIFPPGLSPLPEAVVAHADHLRSDHRELVGPFVVGTGHLAELVGLATPALFPARLRVSVVVPSPRELPATVRTVDDAAHLELAGLEVKLHHDRPATDQVREIAAGQRHGAATYVEVPRPSDPQWPDVLETCAESGLRLKFRTGGTEAAAFPSETEVATWVRDAVGRSVPFKCTAGLHQAVRHTGATTGFEHHGYLNILLATVRVAQGAGPGEVEAVVAQRDAHAVANEVARCSDRVMASAREAFTSYGSCSILEPLQDLADLELLVCA